VIYCGSAELPALAPATNPRIKRQTQPWPEPSESVRPFSVSRHLLASWSGAVRFRTSALLLALLLAVGRLSAFQAEHIPSWHKSSERYALWPVAAGCHRSLLLLSRLLSPAMRPR
jgi:hypothetical protein